MAAQQQGDGFQRVSLSSSDSGHEQNETNTEPCAEALPMELDEVHSAQYHGYFMSNGTMVVRKCPCCQEVPECQTCLVTYLISERLDSPGDGKRDVEGDHVDLDLVRAFKRTRHCPACESGMSAPGIRHNAECKRARASVGEEYERVSKANTPITPPVVGLNHKQFRQEVMGQLLPGDGHGRECFDTFPTFVILGCFGDEVYTKID